MSVILTLTTNAIVNAQRAAEVPVAGECPRAGAKRTLGLLPPRQAMALFA